MAPTKREIGTLVCKCHNRRLAVRIYANKTVYCGQASKFHVYLIVTALVEDIQGKVGAFSGY